MADKATSGGSSDGEKYPSLEVLADAEWLMSEACQTVFSAIEAGGYSVRAVGGAVRNTLLGMKVADVDFATPALPEHVMRLCRQAGLAVHETGLQHGTVTVVSHHVPFEVTTLRCDVETHGRHATVAFTNDWSNDAARRDFTMNAIYCDRHGEIYDPLCGLDDLKARRVRFIGAPRERIREDFLRILRFFRFFAAYGAGDIDAAGLRACFDERDGLRGLSSERICAEILKLMVAPRSPEALVSMGSIGVDVAVFGRASNLERFEKLAALESQFSAVPDAILRLAALATDDVLEARALAGRLKLSNAERRQLVSAAKADAVADFGTLDRQRITLYRHGAVDYRSLCLSAWARSDAELADTRLSEAFQLPETWQPGPLPYKGADVVARGIEPGPLVGKILGQFETWWIDAGFPNNAGEHEDRLQTLIAAAQRHQQNGN